MELEEHGAFTVLRPPIKTGEPAPANPAPQLGAHTRTLLAGCGYSDDEITALEEQQIVG